MSVPAWRTYAALTSLGLQLPYYFPIEGLGLIRTRDHVCEGPMQFTTWHKDRLFCWKAFSKQVSGSEARKYINAIILPRELEHG